MGHCPKMVKIIPGPVFSAVNHVNTAATWWAGMKLFIFNRNIVKFHPVIREVTVVCTSHHFISSPVVLGFSKFL